MEQPKALLRSVRRFKEEEQGRRGDGESNARDLLRRRRQLVADYFRLLGRRLGPCRGSHADSAPPLRDPDHGRSTARPVNGDAAGELSPRMRQTLDCLLSGDSEKQIARKLSISPHTVHVYVKSLYKRYEVCSRGELLAKWVRQ